ncbi:hypothetical protein [Alicyclobacillus ferrooxydans]|uniref:Uncharacterized protein n=1 Tax=Alicyclobacillus ferrooxydans TaxID=471514 RepID=A0A0P9D0T2_9BACL|nr:hypothetical protein [Alicyclobacillus ferrooxydans]KPV43102.1 hypothetical protein AN477_14320 [Alicyclobacillus ferrooxydans]
MENCSFSRSENMTICFLDIKSDFGIIGISEHEDPNEAERLAYEDAREKARVISIKKLRMYHWWKQQKEQQ